MKILHTADWHVGRLIRGRSRAAEHRAALAEIAALAAAQQVDVVVVAGDLFDLASPTAESEQIVYHALLELADGGAHVVLVAGNHDHPRRLEAVKPLLLRTGRVHTGAVLARPDQGGVVVLECRSGEVARVALFPFLSQRGIVRADDLMRGDAAEHAQAYGERSAALVRALCAPFAADAVNLFVGHLLALGAVGAGSERAAHMHDDYRVPPASFDHPALHYVALGHVHAPQRIAAACPIWYSGAPLQLDFGESGNEPGVNLVTARAGRPAEIERHPLAAGRRMVTVRATLDTAAAAIEAAGDAWLRLDLVEAPRPGLAELVRAIDPERVVDVRIASEREPGGTVETDQDAIDRLRRSPRALFAEYLEEAGKSDERLLRLFDRLLEEAHAADPS